MNVTIGVCAMLFGGIVLTEPDTPPQSTYPPAAQSRGVGAGPGGYSSSSARAAAYGGLGRSSYGRQQPGQQFGQQQQFMPTAPTAFGDQQGNGSAASPFMSPTEQPGVPGGGSAHSFSDQPNAGNPLAQQPGFGLPGMPSSFSRAMMSRSPSSPSRYSARHSSRYSRSAAPRTYAEYRIQQTQIAPSAPLSMGVGSSIGGTSSPGPTSKPFSGYRQRPAVSPYMDLFRYGQPDGVDNYNTFVKPRLDQRRQNIMVGGQIQSLQNRTRTQSNALRSLGDQTRALQGRGTPHYFMNRGGYYGGR